MEYTFSKALFRKSELLEVVPVAKTSVDRWIAELKKAKRDLREMGCYQLKGCKYDMWNPIEFIHFINNEKIKVRPGKPAKEKLYDYEILEQEKLNQALLIVQTNNENRKGTN